MEMESNQILLDYKNAANPKDMVRVLADLNQTDIWTMATWLKQNGAEINLQWFAKWNPKNTGTKKERPASPLEDLRKQVDALTAQVEELQRERSSGRDASDEGQILKRIQRVLEAFYENIDNCDAKTILMILDLLSMEGRS